MRQLLPGTFVPIVGAVFHHNIVGLKTLPCFGKLRKINLSANRLVVFLGIQDLGKLCEILVAGIQHVIAVGDRIPKAKQFFTGLYGNNERAVVKDKLL